VKQEKQAEENKRWKKSEEAKSEAGEVGRRRCELEEEQKGLKVIQEKRAEENKCWKKSRRG
jgi:hypothetical protein